MARGVQDHVTRRAAKLAAHQAALPPSERLINRTDWDKHVSTTVSVLTRQARVNSKDAFIGIVVDPNVAICASTAEAEAYFQPGGTAFTNKVLRQFLEASALSRTGSIMDTLSTRSLIGLALNLYGAAQAAGNPIEPDIKEDTLLWIASDMVNRSLAHRVTRKKQTPIPKDITSFLRCLFDPAFMTPLQSTRDILLIALYICLTIDCGSRISELLRPNMSESNLAAYKIEHASKIFVWDRVELFALIGDQGPPSVDLLARVTFAGLKDAPMGGPREKIIPLRLLPPQHCAEDSLFWLINLGIIDNVFTGIKTWSDFGRLRPGPNGSRIPIKNSMKQTPVFRVATRALSSSQHELISSEQMMTQQMLMHLHNLSRFCGLEHAMLPNVLRRGSAYLLALNTTSDERRARMGHGYKEECYWKHYRNTTSTIDFQALRLGLPTIDVSAMSSIFLNQGNASPPDRVSQQGLKQVRQDPQLLRLSAEQSDVVDELVTKYGSLENARTCDPGRHEHYMVLRDKHSRRTSHLTEARFKVEWKEFWTASKQVPPEMTDMPALLSGRADVDIGPDEQDGQSSGDTDMPIDPQIQEEADDASLDALTALVADLDAGEAAGDYQGDAEDGGEPDSNAPGPSKPGRTFGQREAARYSLVNTVPAMLYQQPDDITWSSLSDFFTNIFNHLHSADKFYPGEEPFPGTFACRFCGVHFLDILEAKERGFGSAHLHAHRCEAEYLARYVMEGLQSGDAESIASLCPITEPNSVKCTTKVKAWRPFRDHVNNAHRQSDFEGGGYICSDHSHEEPVVLYDFNDYRIHLIQLHRAPTAILQCLTPGNKIATQEFVYFCGFCQVWIPRTEELEEVHLASHSQDFVDAVTSRGLAGKWKFNAWTHPGFCPFCAYDTSLSLITRLHQFAAQRFLMAHVAGHLKQLQGPILCPATASTPEGLPQCLEAARMDAVQLASHLRDDHGLNVKLTHDSPADDSGAPRSKKKKQTDLAVRAPLQDRDVNQGPVAGQDGKM